MTSVSRIRIHVKVTVDGYVKVPVSFLLPRSGSEFIDFIEPLHGWGKGFLKVELIADGVIVSDLSKMLEANVEYVCNVITNISGGS